MAEEVRKISVVVFGAAAICLAVCGCGGIGGYTNESLYPAGIRSVYVEMFDNQSFRRGIEYELTDALAKRIEAQTPYKIVSDRSKADTVISGRIVRAGESVLSTERQTGRALEREVLLRAVVSWKNQKTGELLINDGQVSASASYSAWQRQGFGYGSALAANNLAEKIVELMEIGW